MNKAAAMPTEANAKMMTSMSTTFGSTLATTPYYKKEGLRSARNQLIVAGVVLMFILVASSVLMVIKLSEANKQSEEDTTKVSELTYKMPPSAAIPATSEHEERETSEEAPTSTPYTSDQEASTSKGTPQIKRAWDAYPLLCTYGTKTKWSTPFPDDGLCDLIFYDSAYKDTWTIPTKPITFSESLNVVLAASSKYKTTKIGVGFAYFYMDSFQSDLKVPMALTAFWDRHVYHFGIIDMPAFDVDHEDIAKVFAVLKELSVLAQKNPGDVELPYIVLGAVPLQRAKDYASQMRNVYSPTLFISQGHFAYGDNEVPDCKVVPPTMLTKPPSSPGYPYDLNDAANALKQIHDEYGWSKWLLSVGMKGRLTKLYGRSHFRPLSSCKQDPQVKPFESYAEVCAMRYLRYNLKYSEALDAMYTYDNSLFVMFMYDDEEALCRKVCNIKSKHEALEFGLAVYDLDYEDYYNNCSARNLFGAFSRLKMVRRIVDYFRTSSGGGDCANDIPCPKRR